MDIGLALGLVVAVLGTIILPIFITAYSRWKRLRLEAEIVQGRAPVLVFSGLPSGPPPKTFPVLIVTLVNRGYRPITITQVAVERTNNEGGEEKKVFLGAPFPAKLEESVPLEYKVPMHDLTGIQRIVVTDSLGKEWRIRARKVRQSLGDKQEVQ